MVRATTLLVLGAVGLSACGPVYKLKEKKLTCSERFHTWGGGLVTHVNQGDGDGSFDYQPLDPRIDRIFGLYDLDSGGFYWDEDFVDGSQVRNRRIDGRGTIWNDGDLDVEYDVVADMPGDLEAAYYVREQRLGCDMTRWVESDIDGQPDPTDIVEGTFTDGGFEYLHRFALWGLEVEAEGRLEADSTYEEELSYDEGGVTFDWYEERDDDGTVLREFDESIDGITLQGFWERQLDGDLEVVYDYSAPGRAREEWTYDLDDGGDGSGGWVFGNVSCDLRFRDFACTLQDCSSSSYEGDDCPLRVSVPPVDVR